MPAPPTPDRTYIVASPKYPDKHPRILGQVCRSRILGDRLGLLWPDHCIWEAQRLELVSVKHSDPKLMDHDNTFYLIGDRKVNEYTEDFLGALQPGQRRRFSFAPPEWRDKREKGGWLACVFTRE